MQARVVSCAMHAAWKEKFLRVVAKAVAIAKDESKRSAGKTDVREAFSRLIKLNAEVCRVFRVHCRRWRRPSRASMLSANLRWLERRCSMRTGHIRGCVAVLCGEEICVPRAVEHGK
jgi:hypothetical protein|eukprot:COSAG02_NODE_2203_length_9520_cov_14.356013_10_plen_117_part_00